MNSLVSIIIPVYNSEKYISETIQSALDQTYKNIEIIVVDDGSTDSSLSLIKSFKHPRIRIFTQPNSGASAARNKGLHESKGEYIQFLDADDLIEVKKIENQLSILINNPKCIIGCKWVRFKHNIKNAFGGVWPHPVISTDLDPLSWLVLRHMMLVHCWLTPKSLITKAGEWDENLTYNDDGEFFARVVAKSSKVLYCGETIAYYRTENINSVSALDSKQKYESAYSAAISFKKTLSEFGAETEEIKTAIGNTFQELIYLFYPKYMDLVRLCESHPELQWSNISYKATGYSKILYRLTGWKKGKKIKYFMGLYP